jgi:CelD/BcsL family acetyltransferase involved in cellulose biosynthesis
MNVAVLRRLNHDATAMTADDGRLARIAVYDDFATAEPHWRALEQPGNLATPYQTYDFLRLWHRHIGAAEGVTPCIVIGFNAANAPLFLWPFGRRALMGGLRVVEFLGGKHANFNMALWRRDVAAQTDADALRGVLKDLGAQADLVMLANQPMTWAGCTNPFALLPQQYSPSFGFSGPLTADFEALLAERASPVTRRKMRKKERTLAGFGTVTFAKASGDAEIRRVLADFFEQKTARMRAIGLPDVFDHEDVRQFISAAALGAAPQGDRLIELYTLSLDDVIVATMGGVVADGRFSAMFSSIIHGRYATESPGEQLLVHVVRHCCERGLHTFDLGIGEAHYKSLFCGNADPMFDSYWPLSASGRAAAMIFRAVAGAKRAIKQQPAVWSLIVKARRLRARLSGAS